MVSVVIGRKGTMADVAVYRRGETPDAAAGSIASAEGAAAESTVSGSGAVDGGVLHLELWLMSCRVLKRDMEYAMMDSMVEACRDCGIGTIMGYYYPTAKNAMVKEFYQTMGFEKMYETDTGVTIWRFEIPADYEKKNTVINV